ncbi:MAG: response regulator [Hydrogenovibrio sp.]|uniref:response regulator n=1 Tax=Hydrogenovibrio sp. TaxID=2065821 RepID=UPI0028700360|nr:response regulator [Hydrogenovibrio sp.]MDR9499518.1 response regulator [Hydrogenovibrio sp.]
MKNKGVIFLLDLRQDQDHCVFGIGQLSQRLAELGFDMRVFDQLDAFLAEFDRFRSQLDHTTNQSVMVIVWVDSPQKLHQDTHTMQKMQSLGIGYQQKIPWIVLSAYEDMAKQIAAFQSGVSHYWVEPDESEELVYQLVQLSEQISYSSYKVVMLDDDAIVLQIQTEILRSKNINVIPTENPMELTDLLERERPDVLVLDLHMPQVCGAQVAWAVRQARSEAELPIVFVSGEDDLEHQMLALRHGGDDFLVKPVNPKQLVETVKMRAQRARQHNRVQTLLKQKLYEQSREHQAVNHHAIVSVADRAGNIVEVNDKFCEISGYHREELIGQNHRMVKSHRHPPGFFKALWRQISSGQSWQGEICNLTKSGQEYWVKSTITPFLDAEGKIYQYVSIRTDITKIKKMELEQEKRLFEQGERVKEWRCLNHVMALLADDSLPDDDVLNQVVHALPPGWRHPDDTRALIELDGRCYATPGFTKTEWCQSSPINLGNTSGQILVCRLQPDLDEEGDGYGILLPEEQRLLDNIALQIGQTFKRRESQKATLRAQQSAERANRAKSDFLSSMSHELRTPLNSIIGFSQLLELSELPDKQKKQIHTIGSSGKHLLSLINDVLEFSKLESGKLSLNIESVDVRPIIDEAVALSESHAYAQDIQIELATWESAIYIKADPVRFKQVVLNLMSNGIKYNRQNGKLSLSWQFNQTDQKNFWQLNIRDTGEGIKESDLERLFEPFDRLGNENSTIEGTGIGLSITKDLVEQMGGHIEVQSQVGVGTTFHVRLPLDDQRPQVSATAHDDEVVNDSGSASSPDPAKTLNVLYVEDTPANMRLMMEVIQLVDRVEIKIAPSAENGLRQAKDWGPQLILLDINLPGMQGDEAVAEFRSLPVYASQSPKIVAVTANVMEKQLAHYHQIGFDQVMAKPFDLNQMIQTIEAVRDAL